MQKMYLSTLDETKQEDKTLLEKAEKIEKIINNKINNQGFNGAVLIAQHGKIINKTIYGYADIPQKTPLEINSAFQLASVSKTFTAVACMQLVEKGKIQLTDPIQQYIPDFPYNNITIHMLLCHRSGLPNYIYDFEQYARKLKGKYPNNDSILKWFATANPKPKLYNQPNRAFSYNNTNYFLLASIVEKVSGKPFYAYMQQHIFEPLGMQHTFVVTDTTIACTAQKCFGHKYAVQGQCEKKDFYDEVTGDKGVYASISDMYKWYYALRNHIILKQATLNEMFTPRSFEKKSNNNYGYGFRTYDQAHHERLIYHYGWWHGFMTTFWFAPKQDFCIIILGNKYNRCVYDIKPIIEILQEEKMEFTEDEINETE